MSSTAETPPTPSRLRTTLNPDRRKIIYGFAAVVALFVLGDILKPGFATASGIQQVLQV